MEFRVVSPKPARRGLIGWRRFGLAPRRCGAVLCLDTATNAEMAEWMADRAADHLCEAALEIGRAYAELARHAGDPLHGTIAGNRTARDHRENARLRLRIARHTIDTAVAFATAAVAAAPAARAAA